MQQGQGSSDHSGAIWVLGILLVLAVILTSPYWQAVGVAVLGGDIHKATAGSASLAGLWTTLGAFLLVVILAGVAQVSEGAGAVALMLLIGLWVWFLLGHTRQIEAFFALLSQR